MQKVNKQGYKRHASLFKLNINIIYSKKKKIGKPKKQSL